MYSKYENIIFFSTDENYSSLFQTRTFLRLFIDRAKSNGFAGGFSYYARNFMNSRIQSAFCDFDELVSSDPGDKAFRLENVQVLANDFEDGKTLYINMTVPPNSNFTEIREHFAKRSHIGSCFDIQTPNSILAPVCSFVKAQKNGTSFKEIDDLISTVAGRNIALICNDSLDAHKKGLVNRLLIASSALFYGYKKNKLLFMYTEPTEIAAVGTPLPFISLQAKIGSGKRQALTQLFMNHVQWAYLLSNVDIVISDEKSFVGQIRRFMNLNKQVISVSTDMEVGQMVNTIFSGLIA